MSKFKTTLKEAKQSNTIVLAVPYCELQAILNYESPIAYNAGRDGWNLDLYKLNNTHSIVTGYRNTDKASTHSLRDYAELRTSLMNLEKDCYEKDISREGRLSKLIELLDYHLVM